MIATKIPLCIWMHQLRFSFALLALDLIYSHKAGKFNGTGQSRGIFAYTFTVHLDHFSTLARRDITWPVTTGKHSSGDGVHVVSPSSRRCQRDRRSLPHVDCRGLFQSCQELATGLGLERYMGGQDVRAKWQEDGYRVEDQLHLSTCSCIDRV